LTQPKRSTEAGSAQIARQAGWAVSVVVLIGTAVWVVMRARSRSEPPARCPMGFLADGARCCAEGQSLQDGRCAGQPALCPDGLERRADGCVARPRRVRINPGTTRIGPGDWEAQGVVQPEVVTFDRPFWLDAYEVTVDRWRQCAAAGACRAIDGEPGQPVRRITFEEAVEFCRFAGGAIPTQFEWQFAASGPGARRYPWGDTGAVCRRASWGLSTGPCAMGGDGPDIAGIHADGTSPDGIFDLAGGVAEWVVAADGTATTCGGSWRTALATGLRTWHTEARDDRTRWDDVGVRCRYASDDVK
jgi:sulfatase modifying factor 1